jgi:hypothetical protein
MLDHIVIGIRVLQFFAVPPVFGAAYIRWVLFLRRTVSAEYSLGVLVVPAASLLDTLQPPR